MTGNKQPELAPIVFVIDDDEAFRKSLKWLIESVDLHVETFASAQEFIKRFDPNIPGCLVLDVRMPGMSGLELQEHLSDNGIELPIIVVTGYGDVPTAVRALRAGAIDFLEKPFSDQILLDQVQKAIDEDVDRQRKRREQMQFAERTERLTRREQQVMRMVVEGLSSKQIAEKLSVSFKTIEAHRSKIMKKMEATNVPHLIRMNLIANQLG